MRRQSGFGRPRLAAMAMLLVMPTLGFAQAPAPGEAMPTLEKWDAMGGIAWHTRPLETGFGSFRDSSASYGLALGRYWTENVKTEVEIASLGTGEGYYFDTSLSQYFPPASLRQSSVQVCATQMYQFFHNAWFHPFVGAGAVLQRARNEATRAATTIPSYSYSPTGSTTQLVNVPAFSRTWTEWRAAPQVTGGFKAYVSYHAFFRADFRVAFGAVNSTNARIGFGLDF